MPSETDEIQNCFLLSDGWKELIKSKLNADKGGGPIVKTKVCDSSVFEPFKEGANCQIVDLLSFKKTLLRSFSKTYKAVLFSTADASFEDSAHYCVYR